LFDVRTLCFDTPGDTFTLTSASADIGTVVILDDFLFQYTPPSDTYSGPAVITYSVIDSCSKATTSTISLTVFVQPGCPGNLPPVATQARVAACPNADTAFDLTPYITDPEGAELTLLSVTPAQGTASFTDLTVTFNPGSYSGTYSIFYTVSDPCNGTTLGEIIVESVGQVVSPYSDTAITPNPGSYVWSLSSKLNYLSGGVCTAFTLSGASVDLGGSVAIVGKTVVFTGDGVTAGVATITVTATTDCGQAIPCQLTLTLVGGDPCAGNLPPVTTPETLSMCGSPELVITISDHAVDPEGFAVSVTAASVDVGSVAFDTSSITFTPPTAFQGNATISYTVEDPCGGSTAGTLTVRVRCNPCALLTTAFVWSASGSMSVIETDTDGYCKAGTPGFGGNVSTSVAPPPGGVWCHVRVTGSLTTNAGFRFIIGGTIFFVRFGGGSFDFATDYNFTSLTSIVLQSIGSEPFEVEFFPSVV
jgi:hypothetical protein